MFAMRTKLIFNKTRLNKILYFNKPCPVKMLAKLEEDDFWVESKKSKYAQPIDLSMCSIYELPSFEEYNRPSFMSCAD